MKTKGKIREYCEQRAVSVTRDCRGNGRLVVKAFNESGFNSTEVDIIDLLKWIKENKPELLKTEI